MNAPAQTSRHVLRALAALACGLAANAVSADCPITGALEAAPLDQLEHALDPHQDSLSELEFAQCQLIFAERLIQTRAEFALRHSAQALRTIQQLGSRRQRSDAAMADANLRLTQGEDPQILAQLESALVLCDEDRDCQAERLLALSRFDHNSGNFENARGRLEQAMETIAQLHGDEHPLMAQAMQSLSQVAYRQGDYDEELALLERAYALQNRLLGADDPAIATTALQLGFSLADRGRYEQAMPLYRRSLDIRLRALGEQHVDTAQSMLAVGSAATIRGEYLLALEHIEKASAIRETLLPPGHANLSTGYIQLAHLQERMGDKAGAERNFRKVLELAEAKDDFARQFVALQGLAGIAFDHGDLQSARAQLEKSLALMAEQNYTSHLWEAGRYMLAEILRELGETRPALDLYQRVLADRSASRPAGDAQVARCRMAVALLQVELGDPSQIAAAYSALAAAESALGPLHPELEELQTRFATVLAAQGQSAEAMAMALRALDVRLHVLAETAVGLSETEALRFAGHQLPALDLALRLALEHPRDVSIEPVWDRLASLRDLVLRRVAARISLSKASSDSSTAAAAHALQQSSERYVRLLMLKSSDGLDSTWGRQLELSRKERDGAERALARLVPPHPELSSIPVRVLRGKLGPGQVLVSLATLRRGKDESYVALLTGSTLEPRLLELGGVADIDALLRHWRASLQGGIRQPTIGDGQAADAALSARLLRPLLQASGEATELLVSATGALHLLPWVALPNGDGSLLVETGPVIRLLNREAELLNNLPADSAARPLTRGSGLLALGDVCFGNSKADALQSTCASFERHAFVALPGTAAEVETLQESWPTWYPHEAVVALTGTQASEARFRVEAPGKRTLHLATHAFFTDPQACQVNPQLTMRGVGSLVLTADRERVALAGLALSNANQRRQLPSDNDGILAAEEIALMDLRGVELAVLSACDTGLGTLTSTEGVLGLRRAFRLAGVRSLVTSLWQVGDRDAQHWMRAFYARNAEPGTSVAIAAWKASADVLSERRAAGLKLDPVHWAGFVATGN